MKIKNSDHRGGNPLYTFQIFSRVVKLNIFALYQNKYVPYLISLNTLVLESIKISWELIVYFSMKIKNSDHRDLLCNFRFFQGGKVKFFRFKSKQIVYLTPINSLVLESIKITWKLIIYFSIIWYFLNEFNTLAV